MANYYNGKFKSSNQLFWQNRTNLETNPPKNVIFWYSFESLKSALIEYVGVWTDESEIENCL